MVLMGMGQNYALYLILVLYDICHVGYDKIDAEKLVIGECHAAVDDEHIVTVFKYGHILADLVEPSKGAYAQLRPGGLFLLPGLRWVFDLCRGLLGLSLRRRSPSRLCRDPALLRGRLGLGFFYRGCAAFSRIGCAFRLTCRLFFVHFYSILCEAPHLLSLKYLF